MNHLLYPFARCIIDSQCDKPWKNETEQYTENAGMAEQPVQGIYSRPDLFDLRAAIFLMLDGCRLKSVVQLCDLTKLFWPEESQLLAAMKSRNFIFGT